MLQRQDAAASKVAFVFQVVSAEFRPGRKNDLLDDKVVAKIRVTQSLRGQATASEVSYTTHWCCGPRIAVGGYYAAFLKEDRRSFLAGPGNLVALGPLYEPGESVPDYLRQLLQGKAAAEATLGSSRELLSQMPPPPPPPCPGKVRKNGL